MGVGRAVQPMSMAMENFIKGASREQVDGVQRIVNQFMGQMNAAMSGQVAALADTLAQMNQTQAAVQQNLQRTLRLGESLVEDAMRIQQSSHTLAASLDESAQVFTAARQEELLALMQDAADQQGAVARSLGGIHAELAETLRELTAWAERNGGNDAVASQAEALSAALERARRSTDALTVRLNAAETPRAVAPGKP